MNAVAKHLIDHGIRPSVQRMSIMEYLMAHATHPTVDTIYQDLLVTIPTLSRTTIYNTLSLLEEKDALTALSIDTKTVHYDGDTSPHAHFMCRGCGKIFDLPISEDANSTKLIPHNFKIEHVKLYYTGLCEDCQRRENKKIKSIIQN